MITIWAELGGKIGTDDVYAKSIHGIDWAADSAMKDDFTVAVIKMVFDGNKLVSAEQVKRTKRPTGIFGD